MLFTVSWVATLAAGAISSLLTSGEGILFVTSGGSGECSGPRFEFVAGLGTETFRSRGCEEEGRARGIVPEEMSENSVGGAKMVAGDNRGLNLTLDTQSSSRFAAGQF